MLSGNAIGITTLSSQERKGYSLPEILLLIYAFLIPIEDFFLQDIIGSSTRYAAGTMIVSYFLFGRKRFNWGIGPKWFYYYFIWAALSVLFWATVQDYYTIFRLVMWMLTTLMIANLIGHNPRLINKIFQVYLVSAVYLAFLALTGFTDIGAGADAERVNVEGINQNLLASHFLIAELYLLFIYNKQAHSIFRKVIIIATIIFFLGAIIATGSRSVLIAGLIGYFIIYTNGKFRLKNLLRVVLIVSLLGVFVMNNESVFSQSLTNRIELARTDKGANRLIIWRVGLEIIKDNPIIGVGYRNFPDAYSKYLGSTPMSAEERNHVGESARGAHNAIIETLGELGIVGLFLFFGFQIKQIKLIWKTPNSLAVLLLSMIVALNVNAFFGDLGNLKYFWLIVGLILGFIWSIKRKASLNSVATH